MNEDREDRIRQRAHAIWEAQGRPAGRHEDHWAQAEREIDEEARGASGLMETLTETIGLAVGADPAEAEPVRNDKPAGKRRPARRT